MISSGMKRGLAASAISALAITGVPAIAFATPLVAQSAAVDLQSVTTGGAVSIKNDGQNTTVSLVASAPATVEFIQFKVGATNIGTPVARGADGDFHTEWTPDVTLLNTTVTITAQPVDGTGANTLVTPDAATGVTVSGSVNSVEIDSKSDLGYFKQPYATQFGTATDYVAGVTGTTSKLAGTVGVGPGIGVDSGSTPTVDAPASASATSTTFAGTVSLTKATVDASAADVDQILVNANNGNGAGATRAEDAEAYTVYSQTIAGITATAKNANVPAGSTTSVTVKVVDQRGNPVAGAHVAPVAESGTSSPGVEAGGFTNGRGEFTFTGATPGAHSYYVDGSDNAGFTNGVDRTASVTVGSFTPRASTVTFTSKDGNAFDVDEYDATEDTYVTVKDQNGNPLAGEFFFYSFSYTPFEPSATNQAQTFTGQAQTGADGVALIPLPTGNATSDQLGDGGTGGSLALSGYVNRDASAPGQDAADLALDPATLKVGESYPTWDGPADIDRQAGTDQTFSGSLALDDGTTLAGRRLTVDYTPGTETGGGGGNSVLAPQTAQPNGTTRVDNDSAIVVTGADGSFSVVVRDPATTAPAPQTDEAGAELTVTGTATVPVTGSNTNNEGIDNDESDTIIVDFLANAAPGAIVLAADSDTSTFEDDPFEELVDNEATPGRPVTIRVRVLNSSISSPTPLAGQSVTLTTDHGFFTSPVEEAADINDTNGGLVPDPAPANGGLYGEWVNKGTSTTVVTDDQGYATVTVAIEKDAGFDDDGQVISTITAKSGTATNSSPIKVEWGSYDALNPGSLKVTPSASEARADDQTVDLDVFAEDQFGNLTQEGIDLADDTSEADIDDTFVSSQFENDDPATYAYADAPVTQNITATWDTDSNTYRDGSDAAGFQAVRSSTPAPITAEASIDWYATEISDASVTMTASPAGTVPVGTAVTETVTVLDQKGNPVAGVRVSFSQAGPGDVNSSNIERITNAQGQAFYTFLGSEKGDAFISAVIETGAAPVTKTDTVTFGVKKKFIALQLRSDATGNKDVLKVNAKPIAEGLVAKVFVDGKKVAQHKLNSAGNHNFKITDKNGDKITTYVVKVAESAKTHAAQNQEKVK